MSDMALPAEEEFEGTHTASWAPRIALDELWWERVQMLMHVHLGEHAVARGVGDAFFLEEQRTFERVALSHIARDGDGVRLRVNITQAHGQEPLVTGVWALWAGEIDAPEAVPVLMDEVLSIDPTSYGGLFTGGGRRYWVFPTRDALTHQIRFDVSYRKRAKSRRPAGERFVSWIRRSWRRTRSAIYVGYYNTVKALVPKNGRRILFTSDSHVDLVGNLSHVHARMQERGLDAEYTLRTIFKPGITEYRPLLDKVRFPYYLATADVVLMDDYQPMVYKVRFDEDVKIIQLWHASGAFKTVGYSRLGKPGGPSPFSKGHKIYTHAIVSSEHDAPFYAEAFGIPDERMHATGIPRMDMFFDEAARDRAVASAVAAFPQTKDRSVILFAPTFRGNGPLDAYYDYELLDLGALHELAEEQDAVVLLKMHPFVIEPLEIPEEFTDRLIDASGHAEFNELLFISDVVITDYSSLVFEYSTFGRPMLFFVYDLEEYVATRDFYQDITAFAPGKLVRTFEELLDALRAGDFEQYKVEPFAAEHFDHRDAGSSDRVIDDLILG